MRPDTLLQLLQDTDAFRQTERFTAFLQACECDSRGRLGFEDKPFPQAEYLQGVLRAALSVNAGEVARQQSTPEKIREAVHAARLAAVREYVARVRPGV
jgi:tRNA nucleotidyltransferase (CCA-adding enzyme)